MQRLLRIAAIGVVSVLVVAGCGGGGSDDSGGGSGGGSSLPTCPLDALQKATKPVNITFWHAMTRANEDMLTTLTNRFNASQSDVKVKLVNQIGYKENLEKYRAIAQESADVLMSLGQTALRAALLEGGGVKAKVAGLAKELAFEHNRISTSLIQRRLRLGYPRAARLMDMLEEAGIVGPNEGGGSRQVFNPEDKPAFQAPPDELRF